jgi:large subunit ribosomal protein L40
MASLLNSLFGKPFKSTIIPSTTRLFSATTAIMIRQAPRPGPGAKPVRKSRAAPKSENFQRIRTLKQNMFSPAPPPLRMARQRYLRHWTIHRAWQLFRRQQHEAISKERQRMHAGMYNACEELRKTVGPEGRGEGYLYRVAMEKKGVWGTEAIPIEYARFQTDSPANEPWNHDWKR